MGVTNALLSRTAKVISDELSRLTLAMNRNDFRKQSEHCRRISVAAKCGEALASAECELRKVETIQGLHAPPQPKDENGDEDEDENEDTAPAPPVPLIPEDLDKPAAAVK